MLAAENDGSDIDHVIKEINDEYEADLESASKVRFPFAKLNKAHDIREDKVETFVRFKLESGFPFTDSGFPPTDDSIYDADDDPKDYANLCWKRLSEIYP